MKVAIACTTRTPAIDTIAEAIAPVQVVEVGLNLPAVLQELAPDFVVNLYTGPPPHGSALVPCILDAMSIPYFGFDVLSSALCQDKGSIRSIQYARRLPAPNHIHVEQIADLKALEKMTPPFIAKPACGTGGFGVFENSISFNPSDMITICEELIDTYFSKLIVEEYVDGREIVALCLGTNIFNLIEVQFTGRLNGFRVFGAEAKQVIEHYQDYECFKPARIYPEPLEKLVRGIVRETVQTFGLEDVISVVNLRIGKDRRAYIIDIGPPSPEQLVAPWFRSKEADGLSILKGEIENMLATIKVEIEGEDGAEANTRHA